MDQDVLIAPAVLSVSLSLETDILSRNTASRRPQSWPYIPVEEIGASTNWLNGERASGSLVLGACHCSFVRYVSSVRECERYCTNFWYLLGQPDA
jgi:hypothetical protein